MFERYNDTERQAVTGPPTRPLPPDFDDLLDRLARTAQERHALRKARPDDAD